MAEEEPKGEATQHHQQPEEPAKMAQLDDKKPHMERGPPPASYHGGGGRGRGYAVKGQRRSLCMFILILLVLVGITALTLWLVYRPREPKFRVVNAAVYELNATAAPFLSASMQFTVVIRNPNRRVSIYYDQLSAYVSYRNQMITPPATLPPLFHQTKSTVVLSPLLGGAAAPVAAEVVNALVMDEEYGVVGLRLVLTGKLRYKAGIIKSQRYGMYVRCDVTVGMKRGFVGQLPLLGSPPCTVDV